MLGRTKAGPHRLRAEHRWGKEFAANSDGYATSFAASGSAEFRLDFSVPICVPPPICVGFAYFPTRYSGLPGWIVGRLRRNFPQVT